jgi:hypothetical protein
VTTGKGPNEAGGQMPQWPLSPCFGSEALCLHSAFLFCFNTTDSLG